MEIFDRSIKIIRTFFNIHWIPPNVSFGLYGNPRNMSKMIPIRQYKINVHYFKVGWWTVVADGCCGRWSVGVNDGLEVIGCHYAVNVYQLKLPKRKILVHNIMIHAPHIVFVCETSHITYAFTLLLYSPHYDLQ